MITARFSFTASSLSLPGFPEQTNSASVLAEASAAVRSTLWTGRPPSMGPAQPGLPENRSAMYDSLKPYLRFPAAGCTYLSVDRFGMCTTRVRASRAARHSGNSFPFLEISSIPR
jgi:hypothetical protein